MRLKAIIFMVEPPIHLLFYHPFYNCSWQYIAEHRTKPGVEHRVPRITIFRDTTHDPGAMPGADKNLSSILTQLNSNIGARVSHSNHQDAFSLKSIWMLVLAAMEILAFEPLNTWK